MSTLSTTDIDVIAISYRHFISYRDCIDIVSRWCRYSISCSLLISRSCQDRVNISSNSNLDLIDIFYCLKSTYNLYTSIISKCPDCIEIISRAMHIEILCNQDSWVIRHAKRAKSDQRTVIRCGVQIVVFGAL